MAKLSDLVSRFAEVTGVPETTVREISRRLREAELISTGKVGRYGGADMTANDAASLLIGLLVASASSVAISDLGPIAKSYLNFRSYFPRSRTQLPFGNWNRVLALPQLCELKKGHSFKEALSALFQSVANGDLERAVEKWTNGKRGTFDFSVVITRPRPHWEAGIQFASESFGDIGQLRLIYLQPKDVKKTDIFMPPAFRSWSDVVSNEDTFDLETASSVTARTIVAIGRLLQNEGA